MGTGSQKQHVERRLQDTFGTAPEYLWTQYPDYAVFRHPASRKWFAVMMNISAYRLGLEGEQHVDVINLRCGSFLLGSLLDEPGFLPAYHMSKATWVSVLLDGTAPDEQLFSLLELSYDSVAPRRRKRSVG